MTDRLFFAFVAGCFVNALLCPYMVHLRTQKKRPAVSRDAILLWAAMALTVAADFCMLIVYKNLPGLCLFCAVQTLYHLRYGRPRFVAVQLAVCLAWLLLAHAALPHINWLTRLAAAYALCLLCAVSAAVARFARRRDRSSFLAAAGMVLFLLCDLCVGLYNRTPGWGADNIFYRLTWVCYLPAQALLSVSGEYP